MSMLLLAMVAVVAWDGLALDARDEAILGPLPIPRAVIVRAKLSAMAVLAGSGAAGAERSADAPAPELRGGDAAGRSRSGGSS